jgi:hypothetical protein
MLVWATPSLFELTAAATIVLLILFMLLVRGRWLKELGVLLIMAALIVVYVRQVAPLRPYVRLPAMTVQELEVPTKNPDIRRFLAQNEHTRMYSADLVLGGKYMFSDVLLANGFEGSLRLRRTARLMDLYQFMREAGSLDLMTFISYPSFINLMGTRLLMIPKAQAGPFRSLGERYEVLASENGAYAFRNKEALPRCFLVHDFAVIGDEEEVFIKLRDNEVDCSDVVILEEALPEGVAVERTLVEEEPPRILEYAPEEVIIEAVPQAGAFLVLTDSFYPGWKAYDNGTETRIYAADYLFRAVYLPPGKHVVRFTYRPASFTWGAVISLAGWTLVAALAAARIARGFRKPNSAVPAKSETAGEPAVSR